MKRKPKGEITKGKKGYLCGRKYLEKKKPNIPKNHGRGSEEGRASSILA